MGFLTITTQQRSAITRLRHWIRRYRRWLLIGGGVLIAGIGAWLIIAPSPAPATSSTERPTYSTVLPASKTIAQLGGWQRVSPAGSAPVYAFTDTIGDIAITVSQQVIPTSSGTTPVEQLKTIAQGFHANDTFEAAHTTVYIGTSAQGPQSVLFVKDTTLVLIKSAGTLSTPEWVAYLNTLQVSPAPATDQF